MQCNKMEQNGTLDSLSPAQMTAVEALLAGKTNTEAAMAAGVGRTSIQRWLKDDFAFQAELNRGRREIRRTAFGNLERLAAKAADCLEKALDLSRRESRLGSLETFAALRSRPHRVRRPRGTRGGSRGASGGPRRRQ
jgi:hypothetical protein